MAQLRFDGLGFHGIGPLSLVVEPGKCVCVSGASGSGKTLMLRAIADLDQHQGDVWLDDATCESIDAPTWRRWVALLPAESGWWSDSVGGHFLDVDHETLADLGFDIDVMSWQVSRLSTGEKQRLALLRLLANSPKALLLDEPTGALDDHNSRQVEKVVDEYREKTAAPVLWVSHDTDQIGRVGDRGLRLIDGQLTE